MGSNIVRLHLVFHAGVGLAAPAIRLYTSNAMAMAYVLGPSLGLDFDTKHAECFVQVGFARNGFQYRTDAVRYQMIYQMLTNNIKVPSVVGCHRKACRHQSYDEQLSKPAI